MSELTVVRAKERMNGHIPYKIFINGDERAALMPNEQTLIEVDANDKVRIIMTWSGSQEITLPAGHESYHIYAKGNLTYNIIGSAGAALFFVMVLVANHLTNATVIKYVGAVLAIALMFLLLYMLTKGKWSWIKLHLEMQ
ncbi:MAG TPA: hypothetical protein VMW01_11625 [Williamwhitmania sp.]|nr:hypothetical protein [Williamwhitmania sp.]